MENKQHPALALLEYDSVAAGIEATDALVKRAPIALLKAGTVHPGHYLVQIGGSVAAVEEAHAGATTIGTEWLIDEVLLPDVHAQVYAAAFGARREPGHEAVCVVETRAVPSLLRAADAAVKTTDIEITEIRMADDLGGRALLLISGTVADIEDARQIAIDRIGHETLLNTTVVPRLDATVQTILAAGTRFAQCTALEPAGAEIAEGAGTNAPG